MEYTLHMPANTNTNFLHLFMSFFPPPSCQRDTENVSTRGTNSSSYCPVKMLQAKKFTFSGLWISLCNHRHSPQLSRNSKLIIAFTHCGTRAGTGASQHLTCLKRLQWHCTARSCSTLHRDESINSYLGHWVVCQVQLQEKTFLRLMSQFKTGTDWNRKHISFLFFFC